VISDWRLETRRFVEFIEFIGLIEFVETGDWGTSSNDKAQMAKLKARPGEAQMTKSKGQTKAKVQMTKLKGQTKLKIQRTIGPPHSNSLPPEEREL